MSGPREASVQWTSEQAGMLVELIKGGLNSFKEAAGLLNAEFRTSFTRCAVAGKAKRLGLSEPRKLVFGPKRPKRQPRTTPAQRPDAVLKAAAARRSPEPYVPVETNIPPGTTPLLNLDLNGCLWASGDGPFHFCNRPQVDGLPYCPGHAALAYRAPEQRRRL